jgi:hypothetical protein
MTRGLGGGADGGQAGFLGAGADLAELVADVLRRPGRFDRVGVAQVQQRAVRHASHVGAVSRTEGSEGLVPGRPQPGARVGVQRAADDTR